jgi:hypothetical protein
MPLLSVNHSSTATNSSSTVTSLFLTLDIDGQGPFPEPTGYLPGTFSRPKLATQTGGLVDDVTEPIGVAISPRWYMKWIRTQVFSREAWGRIWFIPPGASTQPTTDLQRNFVTGEQFTAAFTLFIARPDNSSVQVQSWATNTNTVIGTSSGMMRFQTPMAIGSCRTANFPMLDTATASVDSAHTLGVSSCIFPTGSNWFNLVNTGTTTATVVTLSFTDIPSLDAILHAPLSKFRSPWQLNW